jgi:hypothetical protein
LFRRKLGLAALVHGGRKVLQAPSWAVQEEPGWVEQARAFNRGKFGRNRQIIVIAVALASTISVVGWCFNTLPSSVAYVVAALSILIFEAFWELLTASLAVILPKSRHADVSELNPDSIANAPKPPLVIPVIIRSEADIEQAINCIREVRQSACRVEISGIALLVDFADCHLKASISDAHFRAGLEQKLTLQNDREADGLDAVALYRERSWNPYEARWMGWERKRGKIIEFMRLTRGRSTTFTSACPPTWIGTRYMMSIDVDTRPEEGAVARLIAALESDHRMSIAAPTLETLARDREPADRWLIEPNFSRPICHEPKASQLVYGSELFNGKGAVAIDPFLNSTSDIPENCVLSHDHLEALLSGACAVGSACVSEPFPSTREAWESRQHRWFRGDTQILAWGLCGRSWHKNNARRLKWPARVTALRLALTPINCAIRYAAVLALVAASVKLAIITLLLIAVLSRGGPVVGFLSFIRATTNGYRNNGFVSNAIFYVGNSTLRAVGELAYFQRLAILGAHAAAIAIFRMCRTSRRGLLEWYPDNPRGVALMRRRAEGMIVLLGLTAAIMTNNWPIFIAIASWFGLAVTVSSLPTLSTKSGRRRSKPPISMILPVPNSQVRPTLALAGTGQGRASVPNSTAVPAAGLYAVTGGADASSTC